MRLIEWNQIPKFMQTPEVYKYYEVLKKKKYTLVLKRLFDIFASLILLVLLLPILLVIAIWIKLDSEGPVFYRQERITTYGKIFKIYKFRTMQQNADKIGTLVTLSGDSRITKVGHKIRKLRIDELPQVINILIGDMSFVGTRPEVQKYVDVYTDTMMATLLLPAGVTSLASIAYKDEDIVLDEMIKNGMTVDEAYISKILPEKMKYNLQYFNQMSLINDIVICIKTVF